METNIEQPKNEVANSEGQHLRPEVHRIISQGAVLPVVREGSTLAGGLLVAISMVLLWLSFTPVEWSCLAWIALVPLGQLLRLKSLPLKCIRVTWSLAFLWAIFTLQWMRLGHPAMYLALTALAWYVGLYVPAFVWLGRRCVAKGLPVWLAIPIVWTALEYIRSWLITGFAWYFLSHSQYRWAAVIQISDVTGAYGVTFIIAIVGGAIAVNVPLSWLQRMRLCVDMDSSNARSQRTQWFPVITAVLILAVCLIYGSIRRTPPEQFSPGPVFALIQGNFSPDMKQDEAEDTNRYRIHDMLTGEAVMLQPDIIVWPETMFPTAERSVVQGVTDKQILERMPRQLLQMYGNETAPLLAHWHNQDVQKRLEMHAQASGAAMIIGVLAQVAEKDRMTMYNRAAFVRPDIGYTGRYDKMHRVLFGEYIPFKDTLPWLHNLTPFGSDHGIDAGDDVQMFEYGGHRMAPLICFEDTVPQLVRRIADQRDIQGNGCDVLVNLTNDAWFHGSSELDQHLITAAFRCVETRMPMVRCVNGGISAFIDGNGQIRDPAEIYVLKEPLNGMQIELTPVEGLRDPTTGALAPAVFGYHLWSGSSDPRDSLYVRFGDWFAQICLLVTCVFVALSYFRTQLHERNGASQR